MQETSLKAHRESDHIILLSPTGSGKTLAFLLPLLENLDPGNTKAQAIILTPSRELALQIEQKRLQGCMLLWGTRHQRGKP